ncbi:MAG TPA: DUF547 domain-containing protein [Sedimentisphaerales bacterium]|nr:DUF547 domain-containing protein [Sedimentisphaerales bacterium]
MAKDRVVFITLLTVLAFVAGCLPEERKPTDSSAAVIPKLEPTKAEPNLFEPKLVEPNEIELVKTEPDEPEPAKTEPNVVERPKAEPNEVESPKVEPIEPEAAKTEPNEPDTPKPEPNETEPAKAEPNEAKPPPKVTFHDKCASILNRFVNDKGMVDYKTLKRKRLELKHLLNEFAKLKPNEYNSWPKEDKIAFWINAYNIQMLKIIIDNYPIDSYRLLHFFPGWEPDSILHINRRIGGISNQKFYVMEEEFTLQTVEDRFFRKEFDEPRAFFALCYANLSSPPLRNEPYRGTKLSQQLDDQAKKFLSNPLAFKINKKRQTVYLSYILQPTWFGSEFIRKYGTDKKFKDQQPAVRAVLNCLTNYISRQNTNYLQVENYSIEYMRPNWRLNDSSKSTN